MQIEGVEILRILGQGDPDRRVDHLRNRSARDGCAHSQCLMDFQREIDGGALGLLYFFVPFWRRNVSDVMVPKRHKILRQPRGGGGGPATGR